MGDGLPSLFIMRQRIRMSERQKYGKRFMKKLQNCVDSIFWDFSCVIFFGKLKEAVAKKCYVAVSFGVALNTITNKNKSHKFVCCSTTIVHLPSKGPIE